MNFKNAFVIVKGDDNLNDVDNFLIEKGYKVFRGMEMPDSRAVVVTDKTGFAMYDYSKTPYMEYDDTEFFNDDIEAFKNYLQ
jgi:hypothetical protein